MREKYREVAVEPNAEYHLHTGRPLARKLGDDEAIVDALPDRAVESFAGVGNPFSLRQLRAGERVVDIGSGAGFDSFVAAAHVGTDGHVVGVDMTPEMLARSRATASQLGFAHVEFRDGFAEALPVDDGWADVVISNGVINLCADKQAVFAEIRRVLRPGGTLQFADIANGRSAGLAAHSIRHVGVPPSQRPMAAHAISFRPRRRTTSLTLPASTTPPPSPRGFDAPANGTKSETWSTSARASG